MRTPLLIAPLLLLACQKQVTPLEAGFEPLRSAFEKASGRARVVMLVSPT